MGSARRLLFCRDAVPIESFDQERGYNVAMYRDRGVGYAIASDLDNDQMMKLVSGAVSP